MVLIIINGPRANTNKIEINWYIDIYHTAECLFLLFRLARNVLKTFG